MKNKLLFTATMTTFVVSAFWQGFLLRKYEIKTDKIKEDSKIKLALISDLHSSFFGENQNQLVKALLKEKPDAVLFSGDIFDDKIGHAGANQLLFNISKNFPMFYVNGNHEIKSGDYNNILKILKTHNVNILSDDFMELKVGAENIIVAGLNDPSMKIIDDNYNWIESFKSLDCALKNTANFKILLSHKPHLVKFYDKTNFDLVLCGHAHGGQVRVPFLLNGVFAPGQGFMPKYAGGIYNLDNKDMIVSRGLSKKILPRVFNPPELVFINIEGK